MEAVAGIKLVMPVAYRNKMQFTGTVAIDNDVIDAGFREFRAANFGIRSAARGWSETQHRLVKACRRTAAASAPPSPDNRRFTNFDLSESDIAK